MLLGGDGQHRDRSRPNDRPAGAVLLVEDSDGDAGLVAEFLSDEAPEIELRRVARVEDAERLPLDAFELILLDLRLPDGVGLDVLERIRAAPGKTPIVVLTGESDDRLARQCLERGAQDFIRKSELDGHVLVRAIEHAQARERARQLERKLESADRLATLGRLAATVAHEVNNPATFVQLNSQELLGLIGTLHDAGRDAQPGFREKLGEMRTLLEENLSGINQIVALIQDLQAHTNNAARVVDRSDVNALCRSTCSIAARQLRHRATLRLDLSPMPPLKLSPGRLGQVLMNVVVNASQAVGEGGSGHEVCVATRYNEGVLEVRISDTGVGIPPEHHARIFDPFFTTKTAEAGTGLGLSISRDLVEEMGGRITITNRPERGSVFSIHVPAQPVSDPPPAESPAVDSPRRRVLLVDDDSSVLRPLTRALSRFHDVTPARGAHDALRKAAQTDFEVVFCDLVMPEMDGVQLIEELWLRHPEYAERVVVLSGGATTTRATNFLETSGVPYMTKPTSLRALREMIERLASGATDPEASRL